MGAPRPRAKKCGTEKKTSRLCHSPLPPPSHGPFVRRPSQNHRPFTLSAPLMADVEVLQAVRDTVAGAQVRGECVWGVLSLRPVRARAGRLPGPPPVPPPWRHG